MIVDLVDLQQRFGGNALIGRELYPLVSGALPHSTGPRNPTVSSVTRSSRPLPGNKMDGL
jgi:hypothetical protein